MRSSSCSEFEDKPPLSTSTPIKQEERGKQQVTVVAMSPKPSRDLPGKDRQPPVASEKYQKTDDNHKVIDEYCAHGDSLKQPSLPNVLPQPAETAESSPASPERTAGADEPSDLRSRFGAQVDAELADWEAGAAALARRMDVMLLTVGGVAAERDPAKRLEVCAGQHARSNTL